MALTFQAAKAVQNGFPAVLSLLQATE